MQRILEWQPEWQPEWDQMAGHSGCHCDILCTQMLRVKVKTSFLEGSKYHKVKVDKLMR